MLHSTNPQPDSGFALTDVIVALMILSLSTLGLIEVFRSARDLSRLSKSQMIALTLAQDCIEREVEFETTDSQNVILQGVQFTVDQVVQPGESSGHVQGLEEKVCTASWRHRGKVRQVRLQIVQLTSPKKE